LEGEKRGISFNNHVFPEATAKICAAVVITNEIGKKFQENEDFFQICTKRFDSQKIERLPLVCPWKHYSRGL